MPYKVPVYPIECGHGTCDMFVIVLSTHDEYRWYRKVLSMLFWNMYNVSSAEDFWVVC
jgi:hypothetical protein